MREEMGEETARSADPPHVTPRTDKDSPQMVGNRQMHPAILLTGVGGYLWILGVLAVVLGGTSQALFMIVVSALFLGMYVAIPGVLGALASGERPRFSLGESLRRPLEVWTGRIPGREAALQVVLIPLTLAAGMTVMGVIIALARASVGG